MKAFVINKLSDINNLESAELPIPTPHRQEIVIKVKASSFNYRDSEIIRGKYHTQFPLPLIPLSDAVGEVVAIGEGVTRFKIGDRVCSTFWQRWIAGSFDMAEPSYQLGGPISGMLAEYAKLDEQAAVLAPENLSDIEASTLSCAAVTAWHSLVTEGNIKAGDTVLLQGTGGVSLFALQFAISFGAKVIITSSHDEKLKRAKSLGASHGINYKTNPSWAEEALAITGGRGVDHILEVGGPKSFAQSLKAIRIGGQINVIGYLGGTEGSINPLDIFRRQARVRGIAVGPRASFEAMNRAIVMNTIKPVIDRVYPWTEASEALEYFEQGTHFGKIVLQH